MIYYCLNCTKAVEAKKAQIKANKLFCPDCGQPVYYFGKETAHLSSQETFDAYDDKAAYIHHENTLKGIGRIFPNIKPSLEQLECEELLRYNSKNIKALFQLGRIYQSHFEFSQAKEYYQTLLKEDPHHVQTRLHMAEICLAERRFEDAIHHLDIVIQHIPEDPTLHFNYAVAHHFSGRPSQAIRHLSIAEKLSTDPLFKATIQGVMDQLSGS